MTQPQDPPDPSATSGSPPEPASGETPAKKKAAETETEAKAAADKKAKLARLVAAVKTGWPVVTVGIVGLIALAAIAPHCQGSSVRSSSGFGSIKIDQPEIYTRERLVNDRFEQDDWLRNRLALTEKLSFDPSANVRDERSRDTRGGITAGTDAQVLPDGGAASDAGALPPAAKDPIDDFRDRLAYREEVRTEIIENQLDDSHDIAGNTLYQLKFDATVIPRENVSAFAIVEARMGSPVRKFGCDGGTVLDFDEFDWCVAGFIATVRAFAEDEWKEAEKKANEARAANAPQTAASTAPPSADPAERERAKAEFVKQEVLKERERFAQVAQLFRAWIAQSERQINVEMRSRRDLLVYALADVNGKFADTRLLSEPERLNKAGAWLTEADLSQLGGFETYLRSLPSTTEDACAAPNRPELSSQAEFVSVLHCLLKRAQPGSGRVRDDALLEQHYTAWFAADRSETFRANFQDLADVVVQGSALRVEPRTYTTNFDEEPTWAVDAARLELVSFEKAQPRNKGVEYKENGRAIERQIGFAAFLARLHRASNRAYAYSVRPKESVQRLARESRSSVSSALSLQASAKLGTEVMKSALEDARRQGLLSNALERHPLVVGFSDDAYQAKDSDWAYFGWLIGPRFSSQASDGLDVRFAHHPVHQSLSVIVSAPSWWREAKIELWTYWLDREGNCFKADGQSASCERSHTTSNAEFLVRLPGDADSVDEVLLSTQLRNAPTVDVRTMTSVNLREGEPADIVIPGRHLWRSTVVVLGTQRANSIVVLPDMNGIIARFNQVILPPSSNTAEPPFVELEVWTSEDRAQTIRNKVRIFPKPAPAAGADAGAPK